MTDCINAFFRRRTIKTFRIDQDLIGFITVGAERISTDQICRYCDGRDTKYLGFKICESLHNSDFFWYRIALPFVMLKAMPEKLILLIHVIT